MSDNQIEIPFGRIGRELYATPTKRVILQTATLKMLVDEYDNGLLQVPNFQRDHVWDDSRKKGWARSIREGTTIPVFFVYNIKNSSVYYLADGCQRLYTTMEILSEYDRYGFSSFEEVETFISRDPISIARMSCDTDKEGYQIFVDLNSKGTFATPSEVYKGVMVGNAPSSPIAQLYGDINPLMRERLSVITKQPVRPTRKQRNLEIRSNLALFLQYSSGMKDRNFWDVASNDILRQTPVETALLAFLEGKNREEIEKMISSFLSFISQSVQLIRQCVDEKYNNQVGHILSNGFTRHLLHFCVYCRNTKFRTEDKVRYIEGVLKASNGNSRLNFQNDDGVIELMVTANTDDLSHTGLICRHLGIPWDEFIEARKRNGYIQRGLDDSHFEPFSSAGNGETFPEPASLNRARGANPVK